MTRIFSVEDREEVTPPTSGRTMPSSSFPSPRAGFEKWFAAEKLPWGLLTPVMECYNSCNLTIWLLDNSSGMKIRDSHSSTSSNGGGEESPDNVSRWHELRDCISFHSHMASKCWIRTNYWLVNDDSNGHEDIKFKLCCGNPEDVHDEMSHLKSALKQATLSQDICPLSDQLHKIGKKVSKLTKGERVKLVICTQGIPTDRHGGDFWLEIRELSKLDVKIIIRLCTDEEGVFDLYNTMDARFNNVDVIDDYWCEAAEIQLHNPWLTYGMGLHRLREAGLVTSIFDGLDEHSFKLDELYKFCKSLFVGENSGVKLPLPRQDSKESIADFVHSLKKLVEKEELQWNPVKKKMMPWIDVHMLEIMLCRHHDRDHHKRGEDSKTREHHSSDSHHKTGSNIHRDSHEKVRSTSGHHGEHQQERPDHQKRPQRPTGRRLSMQSPSDQKQYKCDPLQQFLLSIPLRFPPINDEVEPHEYFDKWQAFDEEAFEVDGGEDLKILLGRATKKAKFFFHPDKLPNDLTEKQIQLFKDLWDELCEYEALLDV